MDFPPTTVEADWASFDDRLETELQRPFEETGEWEAVVEELRTDLGFASGGQLLKNPDGAASVVRRGYAEGRRFPALEAIAARVTAMTE